MATLSKMLQINVASPIETAKVLKQTQSHSPCRLVVIASAMSFWPVPGYAAYASTKAALHQFVETLRSEGEGDWVTLVYPAATETDFFKSAGKEIPKAYPVQPVNIVVKKIIAGVAKGKRTIFPSKLFQVVMVANRIIPVFKPIYFFIERKKLRKWIGDKKGS
jgi:short-subunit dehydrogenase